MTKTPRKNFFTYLQALALLLATSLPSLQQAAAAEPAELKTAKPYILEIRYGSFDAGSARTFTAVPTEFLEQAESLRIGVNVPESGFAAAGPLSFTFNLSPHESLDAYLLEYAGEFLKTDGGMTMRSTIQITPSEWIFLGSTMDMTVINGQSVHQNLMFALRLIPSVP